MCGIFGAVIGKGSGLGQPAKLKRGIEHLFTLSESRGKEAAGLAIGSENTLAVYKTAEPASVMLRTHAYRRFLGEMARDLDRQALAVIGHSRLVTDGAREVNRNNQPVVTGGIVGIHNGIIVNCSSLWERHPEIERQYDVDSEVIFALVRAHVDRGEPLAWATQRTFAELQGAASIAALFDDRDQLLLATNNGSLYFRYAPASGLFVFASERSIVDRFAARRRALLGEVETEPVRAGEGLLVLLGTPAIARFSLEPATGPAVAFPGRSSRRSLRDCAPADPPAATPRRCSETTDLGALEKRFPYRSTRDLLRRCTRCVLPETMPFVDFDADGLCAYCRRHRPLTVHGHDALEALVAPYRRSDGLPDCIVGVSGGRDSMFGLHYIKTVLGMNPVAYTYDWGMVTDLARRNISRICGRLGIEHILVSADIPLKREYIRKNVEAWLARPSLGTVPLFMAGDKAYFYFLAKVRRQLGVKLSFLCENLLERTDFKTGFAGIAPVVHDDNHVYTLPNRYKLALASYYAKHFLGNTRYLNSSLVDSAKAFAFYYVLARDFYNLYRYVPWDETVIESTLLGAYDFELAEDTQSTWRIGDGTASFYNYIYYAVAGMTENDTFRSNQIRNGALSRERALDLVERDNRPRFASIQWYLRTIQMDRSVQEVLEIIERIPKLY